MAKTKGNDAHHGGYHVLETKGNHLTSGRDTFKAKYTAGPCLLLHHGSLPHKKFLLLKFIYCKHIILPAPQKCKPFFPVGFQF